jgi:hypothetical protein
LVQATTSRPALDVTADGIGVVSHAGTRLLADVADAVGLSHAFGDALGRYTPARRVRHEPGRVLTDVAVMLADGGEAISDLAVLRDQQAVFGDVASTPTVWRLLDSIDEEVLADLQTARARARERAWLMRTEAGRALPASRAGGRDIDGLVIDLDATLITAHSDKEGAAGNYKGGYGYHPLLAFLDNTGEALAGQLRSGNAGSNTAADHIAVFDAALIQLPDTQVHGQRLLVRTDGAGASKDFLCHLGDVGNERGLQIHYSVGYPVTAAVRAAIGLVPDEVWTPAWDDDGYAREDADVAEVTGLLGDLDSFGWPPGMRVIVRREHAQPGAQLTLDAHLDGWRYQCFATNTDAGPLGLLEARHRAHARVEDRIRIGKDLGLARLPSRQFNINAVWLQLALTAADLIAWTQTILLDGELAKAEPKKLRYRILHIAARITRGQRRTRLRLPQHWAWTAALHAAFTRLAALPRPRRI